MRSPLPFLTAALLCCAGGTARADNYPNDFGDFAGFPGAGSVIENNLKLGNQEDGEADVTVTDPATGMVSTTSANANATASGDDLNGQDDEDGVVMPAVLIQGQTVTIPVSVFNKTGANAYLNAWVDFDDSGTLDDTLVSAAGGEKLAAEIVIPAGFNAVRNITFTVPINAPIGLNRGVRFRLTSVSNPGSDGMDGFGEVEDYVVRVANPGFVYCVASGKLYEMEIATSEARFVAALIPAFTGPGNALAYAAPLGTAGILIYSNGVVGDVRLGIWDRATGVSNLAGNLAAFGMPAGQVLRTGACYGGYYWTIPDGTDDLWRVSIAGSSGAYVIKSANKVCDLWANQRAHTYGDMLVRPDGTAIAMAKRTTTGAAEFYTANLTLAAPVAVELGKPPIFQNSIALGLNGIIYSGLGLSSDNTEWYELDAASGSIVRTMPSMNLSSVSDMTLAAPEPAPALPALKDYGDSSLLSGASSLRNDSLRIGALVDAEPYATTNGAATGDDTTGVDDEDGVTVPASFAQGQTGAAITVNVTNTTAAAAYLNAWMDFNRDGDVADAGEQIAANLAIAAGTSAASRIITFNIPATAVRGRAVIRVRLTSVSSPGADGSDGQGEVEDCVVTIMPPPIIQLTAKLEVSPAGAGVWSSSVALEAGLSADYRLTLTNTGNVTLLDPVVMDLLPDIGDTGAVSLLPRASTWRPRLRSALTAPNGIKSWYSLQQNPRRPEILSPDPLGSILAAWASLIADPTTVRSFKLDGTGLTLVPGAGLTVTWTMSIPWDAPALGSAVNSAGIKAVRADTGAALAPFESAKAIIQALAPTGQLYGDKVWNDANSDGLQSTGETGINGVTVQLFRDNGDGQPDPATDTLMDTTLTADINGQAGIYRFGHFPPGGYFAAVAPPSDNWSFATADAGANDSLDSDPVIIIRNGGRRGLMPVTQITAGEQDLTWDAGLSDRSGSPAVWAIAQPATDKYLIGGRFTQSRGVARKNIALLTAAGTVDTAFNPGAGFDNTVRSLAVRSDGMIIAGGNFVTYNGAVSKGIALLTSAGVWSGPAAQPDTADVNWVAASGTGIYLGGAFSKVGSTPAGNVARLNAFGGVDTNFATGTGANGPVYGGAVLSTGDILLVGGFTQFNGSARRGIVQLGSDGHVVSAFDPGAGASGEVYALKVFDDGRMLLTGNFRSFAGTPCNGTIRLDPQGKVDTTLSPSSLNVQTINSAN